MKRLRFDAVRQILPDLEELRPVVDRALSRSTPDPARTWAGSGELDTVGARLVDSDDLTAGARELAADVKEHLTRIYQLVGTAMKAMEADDPPGAAAAFLEAARLEEVRDRPDKAAAYASAAFRAASGGRDQGPAAIALRRWARADKARGRLEEALQRYEQAFQIGAAVSDARGAAEAAIGAGNVLEEQGRWDRAAEWYRRALSTLDGGGPATPERWHALLNMHIVLRSQGDLDGSAEWLREAERTASALEDESAVPFLENARGQLDMAAGRFEDAEEHLLVALEACPHSRATVTVRLNLAEVLLGRERSLDAAEHAREAEREALTAGLVGKLPEVYRILGRVASARGNPDAFVLFERALEIIRDRQLPPLEEALTLQAYAEAEARRGDPSGSVQELGDRAKALYDSLGIVSARHRWADVFGPATDSGPAARAGHDQRNEDP